MLLWLGTTATLAGRRLKNILALPTTRSAPTRRDASRRSERLLKDSPTLLVRLLYSFVSTLTLVVPLVRGLINSSYILEITEF